MPRYRTLARQLADYPLAPYLRYWELRPRIARLTAGQVTKALVELDGTPLADRLRRAWLRRLADSGRWQDYLDAYRPGFGTKAECRFHDAQRRLGQLAPAWEGAGRLWLVGRSQPRACDPLFAAWRTAGKLTPQLAWARVRLAMGRRELSLARYLTRFLSDADRVLVEVWIAVHRDPARRLTDRRLAVDGAAERLILVHGMRRLARRDSEAAERLWPRLRQAHDFSSAQVIEVERRIALEYAYDTELHALELFAALDPEWRDDEVYAWAVRTALRHGRWEDALKWLRGMPDEQRSEVTWAYWLARMLEETGAMAEARPLYTGLAEGRGFYEFLAADRLGAPYRFSDVPAAAEPALADVLAGNAAFVRARELFFAGLTVDARREWREALKGASDELQIVAARLASHWGWHDRGIFALGAAGYYDDLEIRFPLAFREQLVSQARREHLDPAWVFAVTRQESAFTADARSPAGALGLMQIMPATGRQIARDLGSKLSSKSRLLDPALNLRYGTFYLRTLLDDLDNHPVLVNAAYNAGPHRVRAWLPEQGEMAADIWIETVPFRETRDYLKRVQAYTTIYQKRLQVEVTPLSQRLRPVSASGAGG